MLNQFLGHADDVWYSGFSHSGNLIVTASFDRTLRQWDPSIQASIEQAHSLIQRDPPLFTLVFMPLGHNEQ